MRHVRQHLAFETLVGSSCSNGRAPTSILEGIRDNLEVILNTRQGSVPHLPEYGLPDLAKVYAHEPEGFEYLQRSIRTTVHLYEPRLDHVQVMRLERTSAQSDLSVSFVIRAEVPMLDGAQIQYQTTIWDAQEIEVWSTSEGGS